MKKKLLLGTAVCMTVALVLTLNFNFSGKSYDLSDIALSNVEALANNEGGDCGCYGPKIGNMEIYCYCTNSHCCKDLHGCN